jgi:hypothetical protein
MLLLHQTPMPPDALRSPSPVFVSPVSSVRMLRMLRVVGNSTKFLTRQRRDLPRVLEVNCR